MLKARRTETILARLPGRCSACLRLAGRGITSAREILSERVSLLASPFAAPQKQRRNSLKVMANVDEIANKRSKLKADQTNVTGTSDEEVRPPPDGKGAGEIEKNKQRYNHQNIEQLISLGPGVKGAIGNVV